MIAVLAAGAVGLLSAFLPFSPAEPYLIAAGATTGAPPVALGMAAAARFVKVIDRPRQATGMLLVSAVTGFPPLLAASVYLGRTPMHPAAFAATCLLGRAIRFVTVALAPQLAGY